MYDSIILSSCLFGSVYIFSKSLELINMSLLENKKIPRKLIVINGLAFIISGSIIILNFKLVNSSYFKSFRV
jgi:hypothetical protein